MRKSIIASMCMLTFIGAAVPVLADAGDPAVGSRVVVARGPLNVRMAPDLEASRYGAQSAGAPGLVFEGPTVRDGHIWWFVNFDTGVDGWCAGEYLKTAFSQAAAVASVDASQLQAIMWQLKNMLAVLTIMKERSYEKK